MCQPINTTANRATLAAVPEVPDNKIGSCGRRCSECRLAAMTAGIAMAPSGRPAGTSQPFARV